MTPRDYVICLALAILLLVSCSPTRHLTQNEHLLVDVELKGLQQVEAENIQGHIRQQANIKIPLLNFYPKLEVFYFGKLFYRPDKIQQRIERVKEKFAARIERAGNDSVRVQRLTEQRNERIERLQNTLKNGNFFMRKVGEEPAIYDSAKTKKTEEQISIYLDSKGYFQNQVSYKERFRKKRAYVTYEIKEGPPYLYEKLQSEIEDPEIEEIVSRFRAKSHIKPGHNFDEQGLEQERDRLTLLLRNHGYYYFNKRFVSFEVDTSFGGNSVRPITIIDNPSENVRHKAYTIRNVYVITDASNNRFGISRDTVKYNNIYFLAYEHQYRPKALARKIRIEPGQYYSYDHYLRTQRQLTELGMFRFTNVVFNPVPDSGVHELNAYITMHPVNRFQLSNQLGLSVREQLPGPFFNLRLLMNNVTGGTEVLELGLRAGYEGVYSRFSNIRQYSRELGANVALTVPRIVVPFTSRDFLTRNYPRTRINLGFTYIDRPEYSRRNGELSLQYIWRVKTFRQFIFSPLEINLISTPFLHDDFRDALINAQGQTLLRSFRNNFVSAMNFTFLFNDQDLAQTRNAQYFRGFLEIGGLTRRLTEDILPNLSRFQYAKVEGDYRRYFQLQKERVLATRLHAGVAHPFGPVKSVPYEEYFFGGGGSSVRAWRPRRLGPGSLPEAQKVIITSDGQKFEPEQPGEVIIEGSAEYRFPVFGFIKGALFVDAGNVWTISEDISAGRQGAEFAKNFYREIAVGTGLGIRFDFEFLIVRFDIGTKVLDPAKAPTGRFVLDNIGTKQTTVNFGIGYPF